MYHTLSSLCASTIGQPLTSEKIVFTHNLAGHSEGKVSNLLEIKKQNLTLQIECIVRWRIIGQLSVRRFLIGSHHCITCELHRNGVGERTSE
jgi:hypothetical protein